MNQPLRPSRRVALGALFAFATGAAALRAAPLERTPTGNTAAEKRVLAVLDEVYRNHRYLSVPEEDGRLLRILAESIGAKNVVELGTSTGYSGLWILLALQRTGGRLTTYEIDRGRHDLARQNYAQAGLIAQATPMPRSGN